MLRHPDYTRLRITQLVDRFAGRIYRQTLPVKDIARSPRVDRIPHTQAMKLKYRSARLGEQLGPLFATYWFRLRLDVPRDWRGQRVDLLWDSHSEATLWIAGQSIQGLNHSNNQDRLEAPLLRRARGGEQLELFVEVACNQQIDNPGRLWAPHRSPVFLDRCDLGCFDPLAWGIYHDLRVLAQLEREQEPRAGGTKLFQPPPFPGDLDAAWAGRLLFDLNRFANEIDEDDRATWPRAHRILKPLLRARNGSITHELSAIGHAHIDTAWLWPLAETTRKCVRTFSTATSYMDDYPFYKFACSQAYQYHTIKKLHPALYQRIKRKVRAGQWIPVGGTWVEPDCNLPAGESLIRQFLFGQRFFEREFGRRCREFWNPDVFGYNGQLPQIMRLCGIKWFLTQKLSWNYFNKPLHHTFHWQGIDGSTVLAHFPPADTYNGSCAVAELRRHARQYKENDRSLHAYYLFGWGDGGGGPTRPMLESLQRVRDLQGIPRTQLRSSEEFFTLLENDLRDPPVVVGELYLEIHRGTYTTQTRTKRNNRKSEFLLHDLEFLSAVAHRLGKLAYPQSALAQLWQTVLVHQFHDILPGSSIGEVYKDADENYAQVFAAGQPLLSRAADALTASLSTANIKPQTSTLPSRVPLNTTSFPRYEVTRTPDKKLVLVKIPSYGAGQIVQASESVAATQQGRRITLENSALKAVLSTDGRLLSLTHKPTRRESLAGPANLLTLYDDRPTNWDAWDVDPFLHETGKPCVSATSCKISRRSPLRAEVRFERPIGRRSRMIQTIRLDAAGPRLEFHCEVDWRESRKMLKVAFPFNVSAMNATYEMQFGSVERPTHFNDSLALARYEVPGHKWADLSESGCGVALLTESKYGYSTRGRTMYLSLLRSTADPDPQADQGRHAFAYALYPHAGSWQSAGVVAQAFHFNSPVLWGHGPTPAAPHSFFSVDQPALVLDTVKKAEDSDALVLRLYEAHGSRGRATLRLGLPFTQAKLCNALEDSGRPLLIRNHSIRLSFTPYQILSLILR